MDEFDKKVESFLSYLWKVTPQRSPNSRVLVSRNKREGKFIGFKCKGWREHRGKPKRFYFYYRGERGLDFRAFDMSIRLAQKNQAGERVDFSELGIQLHNPLEAQNGTAIPKTGA